MFEPLPMVEGLTIENAKEDFRAAEKVEQYRISSRALYLPEGLKWKYLPLGAVKKAEESYRVVSAGHCVTVREKKPEIDLMTDTGPVHLQLEKQDSMRRIIDRIQSGK